MAPINICMVDISEITLDFEKAYSEEDYIVVPGERNNGESVWLHARFSRIENERGDVVWEASN